MTVRDEITRDFIKNLQQTYSVVTRKWSYDEDNGWVLTLELPPKMFSAYLKLFGSGQYSLA